MDFKWRREEDKKWCKDKWRIISSDIHKTIKFVFVFQTYFICNIFRKNKFSIDYNITFFDYKIIVLVNYYILKFLTAYTHALHSVLIQCQIYSTLVTGGPFSAHLIYRKISSCFFIYFNCHVSKSDCFRKLSWVWLNLGFKRWKI